MRIHAGYFALMAFNFGFVSLQFIYTLLATILKTVWAAICFYCSKPLMCNLFSKYTRFKPFILFYVL